MVLKIVTLAPVRVAGFKVRTDMIKSGTDCPLVWEKLAPVEGEAVFCGESYGVSTAYEPATGEFDYVACVPEGALSGKVSAEVKMEIPGREYAEFRSNKLEELPEIFNNAYAQLESDKIYMGDFSRPSYELYFDTYRKTGDYAVYIPVVKR